MQQDTKDEKKVKKSHKTIKIITLTIIAIIVIGGSIGGGAIFAIIKAAPRLDTDQILNLNQTSIIYDDKGKSMDDVITTDESNQVVKRTDVKLSQTSQYLGLAFISIEDQQFRSEGGIDFRGITRATLLDIKNKLFNSNSSTQGASTLTQQLIKNTLFLEDSLNNRINYTRKIQEAYLAMQLNKSLSKDDILEAYMNTIFLGGNAYGVEAAAYQYFSETSEDLTLVQSAFIAGMAQNPSQLYPFSVAGEKDADIYINRTKMVLSKMKDTNSISSVDYNDAINSLNTSGIIFKRPNEHLDKYAYESFSRPVVNQVKTDLMAKYNYSQLDVTALLINGGLKIYSTMDKDLQDNSQAVLNDDPVFNKVNNTSANTIQSSAVILDYHNGEVKAIIGGRGNQPSASYNRAVDEINFPRSTGSSIKPLTVYTPAIVENGDTANTMVDDSPLSPELANKYASNGVPYTPSDDNAYEGQITIRSALKTSQNLAAVKLEDQIDVATGYSYAQKFGLAVTDADENIATMALGQFHGGETPLLMSAAYGVFGNSGMYASPRLYTKVVDKTGNVLLSTDYTTNEVIDPQSAYTMYDLLKGPVSTGGTGISAKYGDMPVAGKTGTATDLKDLWFCGLTPYYSAAVWIGNDDDKKFYDLSSNDAALIWGKLMKKANANLPIVDITPPAGMLQPTVTTPQNVQKNGQD